MNHHTRREFLGDVGRGMVIAGLGTALAGDLGYSAAFAEEGGDRLDFGDLRPLVGLMQEMPPDKLQEVLIQQLREGEVSLRQLTAAGALSNAETFGGQDYVGFHTAMAFLPAYQMSRQLPSDRQSLAVLKVLYRNSEQIQQQGGAATVTLRPMETDDRATAESGRMLRDASRRGDMDAAESVFAATAEGDPEDMFNVLQPVVQDDINVHRFVMAHRVFELIELVGPEHAHTMLRQSVRLCVNSERRNGGERPIRQLMPKLLDQYSLVGRARGTRQVDAAWLKEMSDLVYRSNAEQAADAVAAALAEGIDPEQVGQAIALAANMLVLRQPAAQRRSHGDSPGVHGSDAMNAWRNMARVTDNQLAMTGLIVGAYHTARYDGFTDPEYPTEEHLESIEATDAAGLLAEAADAIRQNEQGLAAAAIQRYGEQNHDPRDVFKMILPFTVSEDGRLHGEKFYHTVGEEFATTDPAFRWRHLVALARVTASAYGYNRVDEHGFRAAGYEQACQLLGVDA